jgi:hypothetical protein
MYTYNRKQKNSKSNYRIIIFSTVMLEVSRPPKLTLLVYGKVPMKQNFFHKDGNDPFKSISLKK